MTAVLETPKDEFSGLPLMIAPAPDTGIMPTTLGEVANWHHLYHPRTSDILTDTLGGIALRNCRLQLVDSHLHNYGKQSYHCFYAGPEIPEDEDEQFRQVVLACAGYMPREAIDLSRGEPRRISLSRQQMAILREPSINSEKPFDYHHLRYRYEPVREFLACYALTRQLPNAKDVDEFLTTRDEDERRRLGHLLLQKKIEVATEAVVKKYEDARKIGQLHPQMPRDPRTLLADKLGSPNRRELLFPRLIMQLKLQQLLQPYVTAA